MNRYRINYYLQSGSAGSDDVLADSFPEAMDLLLSANPLIGQTGPALQIYIDDCPHDLQTQKAAAVLDTPVFYFRRCRKCGCIAAMEV